MPRSLRMTAVARDTVRYLPPETKRGVKATLRALLEDPLGIVTNIDARRLDLPDRRPELLRARISDWRIVYFVTSERLEVLRVFHRSEGYDWLDEL